jgi:cytochrome c2
MVNKVSVRPVDKDMRFLPGTKWKEIFVSKPCIGINPRNKRKPMAGHQTGGRMYELPDGRILMGLGDLKHDGVNRKNILDDPNVDLGKFFIIDPLTGQRTLYNTGHRNPQGLTIARDGTIWETEHGPTGGDELNRMVKGENYGWPHVTLGNLCLSCKNVLNGRHDGYFPPVFAWSPGLGISNLIEVRGMSKAWDGNLMVSSLKNQSLHRLTMLDKHVEQDEVIRIGERIRDLYQAENEDIVLWTDSGKIIFISSMHQRSIAEKLIATLSPEARDTIRGCKECHIFEKGAEQEGMLNLWGVYGRKFASARFSGYSDAMRAKSGKWDDAALNAYLKDPQAFIPDNAMGDNSIPDDKLRAEIISFLKKLR